MSRTVFWVYFLVIPELLVFIFVLMALDRLFLAGFDWWPLEQVAFQLL
jgi:hypothetical protein